MAFIWCNSHGLRWMSDRPKNGIEISVLDDKTGQNAAVLTFCAISVVGRLKYICAKFSFHSGTSNKQSFLRSLSCFENSILCSCVWMSEGRFFMACGFVLVHLPWLFFGCVSTHFLVLFQRCGLACSCLREKPGIA